MGDWRNDFDPIGMEKAVNWEKAKGYLRAMVAAAGSAPSNADRSPDWECVEERVEKFIHDLELDGLHE